MTAVMLSHWPFSRLQLERLHRTGALPPPSRSWATGGHGQRVAPLGPIGAPWILELGWPGTRCGAWCGLPGVDWLTDGNLRQPRATDCKPSEARQ